MNDDDVLSHFREHQPAVTMTVPVERIIHRGRVIRTRRRLSGFVSVTAGAVAVAVVLLASHDTSPRVDSQLAAWTVQTHPGGVVDVTVRELKNPTGLQSELRADGVAANVSFGSGPAVAGSNPCRSYGDGSLLEHVVIAPATAPAHPQSQLVAMAIRTSELPSGVGVQIIADQTRVGVHLVTATQACTG